MDQTKDDCVNAGAKSDADDHSGPESHLDVADFAARVEAAAGRGYPPVESWHPAHEGTIDMRIAADGTWYYQGTPITRPAMVRMFATILRREPDGSHVLVTPAEKQRIQVDVAPLHAVEMLRQGRDADQVLAFRTLTDDMVTLDREHPLTVSVDPQTAEPTPLILVRGGLQALIVRSVFYDLVEIAEIRDTADGEVQGVMSAGTFHVIGRTDGTPL